MSELKVGDYVEIFRKDDERAPYRTGIIEEVTDTTIWVDLTNGVAYPADLISGRNIFKTNEETELVKAARLDAGDCTHDPRFASPDDCVTCIARRTLKEIGYLGND